MSLDLARVEKLVELSDGMRRGRCPACAEAGGDRKGQHLRIYPDGKFGCCVHPADNEHRRRIFALVGERKPRGIAVRVASAETSQPVRRGILKALAAGQAGSPDAPDGVSEVETAITEEKETRTGRTGEQKSNSISMETENQQRTGRTGQQEWTEELLITERTLRTPQYSLRGTTADNEETEKEVYKLKGFDDPVRCVRQQENDDKERQRLPYVTCAGDLVIPFDSPERYHWWKPPFESRMRVKQIKGEALERKMEEENGATF
jgi:hypothetical protein